MDDSSARSARDLPKTELKKYNRICHGKYCTRQWCSDSGRNWVCTRCRVVTFRTVDENGIKNVHDDLFVERYFTKERRESYNEREHAFYFGYLVHLLTDKLWASKIVYGAKEKFSDLFEQDNTAFWKKIKRDWYDLDFLYLKKYPEFEAFGIYEGIKEFKNNYLDFFAEDAFVQRKKFIIEFYREGVEKVKERETYISLDELDAFVEYAVEEITEAVNEEICV